MSATQIAAFVVSLMMAFGIFILAYKEKPFGWGHIVGLLLVVVCYFPMFGYFPTSIQLGKDIKVEFYKELRQQLDTKEQILGTYNPRIVSPIGITDLRGGE